MKINKWFLSVLLLSSTAAYAANYECQPSMFDTNRDFQLSMGEFNDAVNNLGPTTTLFANNYVGNTATSKGYSCSTNKSSKYIYKVRPNGGNDKKTVKYYYQAGSEGSKTISSSCITHPADSNGDWKLSLPEMAAYNESFRNLVKVFSDAAASSKGEYKCVVGAADSFGIKKVSYVAGSKETVTCPTYYFDTDNNGIVSLLEINNAINTLYSLIPVISTNTNSFYKCSGKSSANWALGKGAKTPCKASVADRDQNFELTYNEIADFTNVFSVYNPIELFTLRADADNSKKIKCQPDNRYFGGYSPY